MKFAEMMAQKRKEAEEATKRLEEESMRDKAEQSVETSKDILHPPEELPKLGEKCKHLIDSLTYLSSGGNVLICSGCGRSAYINDKWLDIDDGLIKAVQEKK